MSLAAQFLSSSLRTWLLTLGASAVVLSALLVLRRIIVPRALAMNAKSDADLISSRAMIRSAAETQDDDRFDRSHLATYSDFSINFETIHFVRSAVYQRYMDIQEAVNLSASL